MLSTCYKWFLLIFQLNILWWYTWCLGRYVSLSASKINFMYSLLHKGTITLPLREDSDENEYSCFEKGWQGLRWKCPWQPQKVLSAVSRSQFLDLRISGKSEKMSLKGPGIGGLMNLFVYFTHWNSPIIRLLLPSKIAACNFVLFSDNISQNSHISFPPG